MKFQELQKAVKRLSPARKLELALTMFTDCLESKSMLVQPGEILLYTGLQYNKNEVVVEMKKEYPRL